MIRSLLFGSYRKSRLGPAVLLQKRSSHRTKSLAIESLVPLLLAMKSFVTWRCFRSTLDTAAFVCLSELCAGACKAK